MKKMHLIVQSVSFHAVDINLAAEIFALISFPNKKDKIKLKRKKRLYLEF
jgi:hypothetical protein